MEQAPADARQGPVRRGHPLALATSCRRTRSSPTARATSPAGCTGTSTTRASARSSARPTGRWATAIRRRWRRSSPQPNRTVVALCGDGDFLMNGQEIATAVQYGAGFRRAGREQRAVRHDPHAPGARVSRGAYSAPSCRTRISPRTRAPSAATARRWSGPKTSRRPTSAPRPRASRR